MRDVDERAAREDEARAGDRAGGRRSDAADERLHLGILAHAIEPSERDHDEEVHGEEHAERRRRDRARQVGHEALHATAVRGGATGRDVTAVSEGDVTGRDARD